MSNISGQLIKDSYNYVLQSDLISGIVYRIGGSIAENPKFVSGLTVNASFTYSDGSEFPGYVLTCDAAGNAVWSPVSGATSGVVVTGGTFDYSAGTLTLVLSNGIDVPISGLEDIYVTGGVVSGNSIVFSYNDINTFQVTGITPYNLFSSYTASTQVTINNKLDTSGFTAYTATTQPLILNSVTGGTYSNGTLNLINNSGVTIPISGFTTGGSSTTDSYVTGFTLDNETITLSQNRVDQYSAFSVSLSGYVTNNIFSSYTASTQSTINNKLDTSGFTAYTATTQPLILNSVTGGTYSGGTLYLVTNSGNTVQITGFSASSSSTFTGGTVTGPTDFTNGLTANTISATTYYNLPVSAITNGFGISASTSNGIVTITNTAPDQIVTISGGTGITTGGTYPNFTLINSSPDQTVIITGGTNIQITGTYPSFGVNFTGSTSSTGDYLPLSGGTVTGGTNFTDGLTANTISATTYYNLPKDVFVTGGTYTSGNAIFTNNTGGTFIVTGFAIGGGGSQPFYLNISQSKNGNRYLSTTASTAAEQSTGVTIANGVTGTIASFQSDELGITLIPGGIWAFYLHSYKSNNNASFNIFVEVYKRTSGGTETLLFTTDPTAVTSNSPNPTMQLSDAYFSGTPLLVSDSIVARVRATNTSNQSHVITLFSEGTQHYSYAVSSIPTQQGLTCDTLSGCSIIQTIQTDVSNKFDKSGGTINGNVLVQNGLTANTISATTYQNLPISGLTAGQNISITGSNGNFTITFTGTTGSNFTGNTSASCVNDFYVSNIFGCSGITTLQTSIQTVGSTVNGTLSHAEGNNTSVGTVLAYSGTVVSGLISLDPIYGDLTGEFVSGDYLFLDDTQFDSNIGKNSFLIDTVNFTTQTDIQLVDTSLTSTTIYVLSTVDFTFWIGDKTIYSNYSHAEGAGNVTINNYSHSEGRFSVSFGFGSHAEGFSTKTIGIYSHSEGSGTFSIGDYSHAEGEAVKSVGNYSHAEGQNSISTGEHSHAEGRGTQSIGVFSHSEGNMSQAIGDFSHGEGNDTKAIGDYSHTMGYGTEAQRDYQLAIGEFNKTGNTDSLFVIGNGTGVGSRSDLALFNSDSIIFNAPLTATSISATTYLNLPTSSSFTGGTVSGATRFTGGLTANTISATTYQNLPATPFLPLSGGTVNGQLAVNSTAGSTLIVTSSNNGTSYGIYSLASNGVNAYGVYGVASAGESESITNGIGGYFASDNSNGGNPTNRYSLQLKDGTEGLNKVLTSVTSDGKSNWSSNLNVSAVTATTITSNSVKVLPVALTVVSNTASTDASLSSTFTLTLTGNTTLATPTNGFSGQRILYQLKQDGTGSKLLTLSSGFRSGPITVTLSTAANTTDYLGVIYNAIDNKWDVLALNKGYS